MTLSQAPAVDFATRRAGMRRAFLLAAPCLLAIWTLALHLPFRGLRGPDDAFYVEVAHLWLSGAPPYLNAFDVKPPGYFALLALAQAMFGPTLAALNGLTAICEFATGLCLWRLGREFAGPAAGVFAAFGYPLLSCMLAANPAYPPLALATTAAFALAVAPWEWRRRVRLAGFAIGLAIAIKQTAGLEGLALLWLLLREPEARGRRLGTALEFAAAALVAPLALALLLASEGALGPMLADVVAAAARRPTLENDTASAVVWHFVNAQIMIWPLVALAAVGVARLRALLPGAPVGRAEGLALWLAAAWVELALQHARWALYLGPTFAPLLLLAGAAMASAIRDEASKRVALAALLLTTAIAAYPFRAWRFLGPDDDAAVAAAAPAILARRPGPHDRLLAIHEGQELNFVVGLAPPTRYFHWMHLICDFPGAGPQRLREALAAAPRFIVAPRRSYRPYCVDPRAWPLIHAALTQDYRPLAQTPPFVVYERLTAR
ncbi:MAG TPA: glycosyltransferase family 39 protein [Roseiarcus sp.]|nr:glycosyltransferase family 39 protein [Roseiarcus sp.]